MSELPEFLDTKINKEEDIVNPVTGESWNLSNPDELVEGFISIKELLFQLYKVKDRLESAIIRFAPKPDDAQTAHLQTKTARLKISYRSKVEWNQNKLSEIWYLLDEKASDLLKRTYKPIMKRLNIFLRTSHSDETYEKSKTLFQEAMIEVPTKPYIQIEEETK